MGSKDPEGTKGPKELPPEELPPEELPPEELPPKELPDATTCPFKGTKGQSPYPSPIPTEKNARYKYHSQRKKYNVFAETNLFLDSSKTVSRA